jgi:hypothetical protein
MIKKKRFFSISRNTKSRKRLEKLVIKVNIKAKGIMKSLSSSILARQRKLRTDFVSSIKKNIKKRVKIKASTIKSQLK